MTISFHLHQVTFWLLVAVPSLLVLGLAGSIVAGWLGAELEAIAPMAVGFVLALVALVLAVGSVL